MQRQQPTLEDRLILAQVVHLLGASEWQVISNSLLRVSVDRGRQIAYTALECETLWSTLMRQINVNLADPAIQDRVRAPQAPESLELVKRLFHYRLTELHQHIAGKEDAFRLLNNELNEIKSGAWDERIAPKKPEPAPVTPAPAVHVPAAATASSSSSQLSSIDSPVHTPTVAVSAPQEEMDIDEADVTLTQKEDEMEAEPEKPKSPAHESPVAEEEEEEDAKAETKDGNSDAEGDSDESDDENEEEEKARPIRGLRSRKAPVLEPLEIPSATSPKASRKGKGHKASDSTSQPSKGRRRNGPESAKPPQSPGTASVAGTFESAATPAAATDENVSVADDGGRRRSTRGHKRKASEMDVDLPAPSLKRARDRSSTIEDEPMTPAVPSSATGRSSNKIKQTMTSIITLLISNNHAELFRRPVTKKDAPDYAQAVQKPTDLATIQRAIKAGQIASWDELERELRRMLANCCVYNRPGTSAYETAKLMLTEVEQMLKVAREGAGDGK